MTKISRQF